MVKQISLFPNERLITPVCSKCWHCGGYFPLSSIRHFDVMYPSGHVGAYQACADCYKLIKKNGYLVLSEGDEG